NNPHPLSHLLQYLQSTAELVLRMRGRHDGAQACLAFRHRGKGDAGHEYAFLEQLAAEVHGQLAFADDNRRDRRFAGWRVAASNVEAEQAQLFLEETCIAPQLVDQLRLFFQDFEGSDAGGRDRRRMRGGEQERTSAVIEEVNQIFGTADVAAQRANGFGERAHLDINPAMYVEMVNGAAAVASQDA